VCCKYMHGGAAIGAAGFRVGLAHPGVCVVAVVGGLHVSSSSSYQHGCPKGVRHAAHHL
jgi:hypothetical protein